MLSDYLAPDSVGPLLTGRFGRPYRYRTVCASTQELLDGSEPEGAVAVCEEQTAGRGRQGRGWTAPAGSSVLCSVLLRPPPGRRLPELSLVGGLAAADTVETALGRTASVKWPNDVLVDGRKVAGVLAEARGDCVVLGTGLNVNQRAQELPPRVDLPATSLRASDGVERPRGPLLATLLAALEQRYRRWLEAGGESLYADLAARDFLRGRRVTVGGAAGVAAGIDRKGRLLVDTAGRLQAVESGEVVIEGPRRSGGTV